MMDVGSSRSAEWRRHNQKFTYSGAMTSESDIGPSSLADLKLYADKFLEVSRAEVRDGVRGKV